MGIAQADKKINIHKIIEQTVRKVIKEGIFIGAEKAKAEPQNAFQQTEVRLYAYSALKENIEKYNKDIEDLDKEDPSKSKSIVVFSAVGGGRLTPKEIQEGRKLMLQAKIYRDQSEIDEINLALVTIEQDEYYGIISKKYFEGKSDDEIAEGLSCDPRTVRRNKKKLVRKIAIKLYGAQAL